MKGRYDDLGQESWDSACDNMPRDYLDDVMAQINAIQPAKPRPADCLDSIQQCIAADAKIFGRQFPREGQPAFDAPLTEWYREYKFRQKLFVAEMEELIRRQEESA